MGRPVVHFEVLGKDGEQLQHYYSQLFGWEINAGAPSWYGVVSRDGNTNGDGIGIGGGVGAAPGDEDAGHVTFYVEVPDVEASLAEAERLGGRRLFGPAKLPGSGIELGQFADPEGHTIGLTQGVPA